jgi:tetratricopeptide (TPR) repeat protein
MSFRRLFILAGILSGFLLGSLGPSPLYAQPAQAQVVAGTNAITNFKVTQIRPGVWRAEFDYFYTGTPPRAALRIDLLATGAGANSLPADRLETLMAPAHPGSNHVSHAISYPGGSMMTGQVVAKLLETDTGNQVIASQQIDQVIDWPDFQTYARNLQLANNSPADNLKRAVALIDSEQQPQIAEAKSILEELISENPRLDAGYVELARVAMKSDWGPEGFHQAEGLLSSALQIQPDSANAKILLGYVYAHQNRFPAAEAQFVDVAKSNPPNLWLWANWGEMLAMEGKTDAAMTKYREAIKRPMTHDSYDRARAFAYEHLLDLLEVRKDYDGMEALYKQRVAEFGPGACYTADYAEFKLQIRGDPQGAIDLARGALNQNCDDTDARRILGLADYVKWAGSTDAEGSAALNEARIYLPPGPMPLYWLAKSERTLPAAKRLLTSGEQIDERDSDGQTALAYALENRDLSAAKRLLTLGARPDLVTGPANVPAALIPVMEDNLDGIRLMQQFGVDYTKLRFRGATAIDFAKQSGDSNLLEALTRGGTTL